MWGRAGAVGCFLLSVCSPVGAQPTGLRLTEIASGLDDVVAITHAGDHRLFIVEKGNRRSGQADAAHVWLYDGNRLLPQPYLDLSDRISTGAWGEGGLLSIAFAPDFQQTGHLYGYYVSDQGESRLSRFTAASANSVTVSAATEEILLRIAQPFGAHFGGQLHFGPDGYLYLSTGDGGPGSDPDCRAQDLGKLFGKILRIDPRTSAPSGAHGLCGASPSYAVPDDNPFVGVAGACDEIWAYGLRNPWRWSFDRLTGDLLIGDVGEDAFEEVNTAHAGDGGVNFGWRRMEGTACFDPDLIDPAISACTTAVAPCGDTSLKLPVLEYDQSDGDCSITGGYVYRGSRHEGLIGSYLFGDWCSGRLWFAGGPAPWARNVLGPELPQVTTFGEDRFGEIYLSNRKSVFRLDNGLVSDSGFESGDLSEWSRYQP